MIIGNKDDFAVELYIHKEAPQMGCAKLWLQDRFIGTSEDLIFLEGYLIALLDELSNSKPFEFDTQEPKETEIFTRLKSSKENRSEYAVLGATFTDDFEMYSFANKDSIFVIWKIRDSEMIFEDLKNYSSEIHIGTIKKSNLDEIKKHILKKINLTS